MQTPYFFFGKTHEQMGTRYQLADREDTNYDDTIFADFECHETPDGWLLYEGEIDGEDNSTLAYSSFATELNPQFHIHIFDTWSMASYVLMEDIRFTLPEDFEMPAGE